MLTLEQKIDFLIERVLALERVLYESASNARDRELVCAGLI